MQTVTLEITNDNTLQVLQDLQEKHFINILAKPNFNSVVFPGKPLTTEEFKHWIESRKNGPSLSLKDAKAKWAKKKIICQNTQSTSSKLINKDILKS